MNAVSLRKNKWVRRAAVALLALLAFWLIAWLAVPPLLKSQLQKIASEKLGRQVTVGKVDFKPWTLELTLDGLRVAAADPAQPPQLEVGRLYADAELQSLLRLAPVVDAVRVERPRLHIVRAADGHYDFEDILQRLNNKPDEPQREAARFAIYNISVSGGAADVDDRSAGHRHELRDLVLDVPFLSNLASKREVKVEPKLAFVLNGSRFDSGAQSTPFAEDRKTSAQVKIQGFDLAPYLGYVPPGQPYKPLAGTIDADLRVDFAQGAKEGLRISGTVQARKARIGDAQGRELLAFESLRLQLVDTRPLEGQVHLSEVRLEAPHLSLARAADGRFNALPAPDAAAQPARPVIAAAGRAIEKQAWQVQVDQIAVQAGKLDWRDATLQPAAALALGPIDIQASAVRWPMDRPAQFGGSAGIAGGRLQFKGQASDKQAQVQAEVEGVPLSFAAPYLAQTLEPALDGKLGAQADLSWAAQPAALKLKLSRLQADALALSQGKTALANVGRVEIADADIDLTGRRLAVGTLHVASPKLRVARDAQGRWMYEHWLKAGAHPAPAEAAGAAAPAPAAKPWALSIGNAALDGGAVSYSDEAQTGQRVAVEFTALALKAQNIVPGGSGTSPLEVSGRVAGGGRGDPGRFDYKGRLALKPLVAEGRLELVSLPVHAFKAYYSEMAPNIDVRRASLNYRGQVRYAQEAGGPSVRLAGDTAIDDLRINSALVAPAAGGAASRRDSQLLSWKTLGLRGVQLRLAPGAPLHLDVRETALTDLFARLLVDETGRLRLQDYAQRTPVAAPQPAPAATTSRAPGGGTVTTSEQPVQAVPSAGAAAPAAEAVASAPPAAPADAGAPRPVINFGPMSLVNGRIDFTDRFVKPNYSADLSELTGKLSAFSSQPQAGQPALADLELHGKAQQTASLEIVGKLNPLAKPLELDIGAKVRDLELAPLSPYSTRYAGHGIERGKLDMDLNYKVAPDGRLTATNKLVLNQLAFGDEVPGAERTLPVKLAVALLADSHGVIDVDLPLSGSINDPQFSLGPLIWKGIVNLIVKAVAAPFKLLTGGLGGGGSGESNTIAFAPGSAALDAGARESLDKVVKALAERPALKMTVIGTADLERERSAYQRERVRQRAFAEKRRAAVRADKPADEVAPLTDAEYPELLQAVYKRADITKPRNMIGLAKDLPVKQMEDLLMADVTVNEESMRELATARAVAVRDYLLEHKLAGERLFLGAVQAQAKGEAWQPGVELKLDMR